MSDLLGTQRAVWRSTRSTTEKIVLLAIIDHYSDRSPEPWPSVPTLAACASLQAGFADQDAAPGGPAA